MYTKGLTARYGIRIRTYLTLATYICNTQRDVH